ncbi:MAG: TIGR01777 family protein [Gammaproteobacteria bacterium]|nr:TIGR01777 family protein [Gammaproteobacteria bacterium]MYD75810.1 TIGR01777 family protein [Gammaproteobacteria bacterium]MYJ52004.1 TIGR01777 family protein [Gammaproteobacteria bacterium]
MSRDSLNVLITGGTGLIGQALIPALENRGHRVSVLTRRPDRYPDKANRPRLFSALGDIPDDHPVDAVINLAGARIVGPRWTERRKQVLRDSRIGLTKKTVQWMSRRPTPPAVLISGSAVGYYGDRHDDILREDQPCGEDFGALLCRDWEAGGLSAEQLGIRVAVIRTGLVLSGDGGMLPPMLRSFGLGLGARIGSGRQWMSWIHIDDQVGAVCHLLSCSTSRGAYNLTAPEAITNTGFSDCLARVLRRPRLFAVPAAALRLVLGEAAILVLGGQRTTSDKLREEGFEFRYPHLEGAFRAIAGH